ncbi:putative serine carboxypeptidase K10B2.2 [Diplonema papillatum]|nr:putative serine carboxypeptidase K10B2.2 [Diplonema papillatum]|eukprot:gene17733-27291_t
MRFTVALAAVVAAVAQVPPTKFHVTSLPGMTGPLPSAMYSGFVNGGVPPSGKGTMYYHYVMFESEEDPAHAPTVFWYNGGPGASSLFGLFQELGPLYLNADSEMTEEFNKTGIPTPLYNPHTWTKHFNLIAIDSPAPVGYSYCTEYGPSGNGTSCGPWKDEDVFKANHKVVTTLMNDIFPELKPNPLYITGESYAGVYVPGLIGELLNDTQGLNLKGFAVGDGCMGIDVVCMNLTAGNFEYPSTWAGPWYDIQFFAGHGQVSNELYNKIRTQCPEANLRSGDMSAQCHGYVKDMAREIGGFFVYDLYDDCPSNMISQSYGKHKTHAKRKALASGLSGAENDYACSGTAMTDWLARPEVLAALGIPADDYFFNADNGIGFQYTESVTDVRSIYKAAQKAGLRILTYEGDADASGLSSYGLQDVYVELWKSVGLNKTQTWRPWTYDGRMMAGYAMEWNNNQVAHLTIRGSGHMVPLNKPKPALTMITNFITNVDYPTYPNTKH